MTLLELESYLNSRLNKFEGCKIDVNVDFHFEIDSCVKKALTDIGLDDMLEYSPWCIKLSNPLEHGIDYVDNEILRLHLELNEDKRYKRVRRGTIESINFMVCDSESLNLTIPEYISKLRVKFIERRISQLEYEKETLIKELDKVNCDLIEFQLRLIEIKN